jgi:hypothetical protein
MQSQVPDRQPKKAKPPHSDTLNQLRLTLRDVAILEDIYTARFMTVPQIQALHWRQSNGGQPIATRKACQRRMRQLFEHGLVRRIEPLIRYSEGKKPLIYAIAKGGAQILANELGIEIIPSDYKPQSAEENYPFLQHILDTTALRIAFTNAAQAAGIQLELWRNERELKSEGMSDVIVLTGPDGKQHKAAVVPDAVICLNRNGKRACFLIELDRRTVTVDPSKWEKRGWARKVRQYLAYFAADAYKQRYGNLVAHVLTVTTGEKRLDHLAEATKTAGGGKRFWFTTFASASQENILTTPIWARVNMEGLHALLR